jgi:hypothetical protein
MQKIKILYSIIVMLLISTCTTIEGHDCQGRTDFPTTPSINSVTALSISNVICDCLNKEDVPAIQISIIDSLNNTWTLSTGTVNKKRTSPAAKTTKPNT